MSIKVEGCGVLQRRGWQRSLMCNIKGQANDFVFKKHLINKYQTWKHTISNLVNYYIPIGGVYGRESVCGNKQR